jgi:hypothetical protein
MSRISVRFERFSNAPRMFRLYQTPQEGPEPSALQPFLLTPAEVAGTPRAAGEKLLAALKDNEDVSKALDFVLAQKNLIPVYLEMAKGAEIVDAFPWEFLFSDRQRFLALSQFWPIARSLYSATLPLVTFRELTILDGRPQIRVLVVLGAGDDWVWEWKAFRELRARANSQGCDLQLRILVGHRDASITINKETGAQIASAFTNLDQLWDLLRDEKFVPNVIHFLCHGTGGIEPIMHCATVLDHETRSKERMDVIAPSELLDRIPKTRFLWMIVLNCCELADATGDSQQSFARGLLGNEAPVVIAHREPIEVTDAAEVTRGLYESLFIKVKATTEPDAGEMEWADVLALARDKLLSKHRKGTAPQTAESTVQWSLPVIYVTASGFVMRTSHDHPDPTGSALAATESAIQGELLDVDQLPDEYRQHVENIDSSGSAPKLTEDAETAATGWLEQWSTPRRKSETSRKEDEKEGFATS